MDVPFCPLGSSEGENQQLASDAKFHHISDTHVSRGELRSSRCCGVVRMWERRKATHGELLQVPMRSSRSIMALVLNYERTKRAGADPIVTCPAWMTRTSALIC